MVESCSGCLNGNRIGDIGDGNGNYLRIKNISVPTTGTYNVTLYYTEGSDGGARSFTLQINNGTGPTLSNLTGTSWTAPAAPVTFQANFTAGSGNSVGFFNTTASAPDVDHIVVSASPITTTTRLVAYLPDYNGSYATYAKTINFAKMTELNLAFAVPPTCSGTCTASSNMTFALGSERLGDRSSGNRRTRCRSEGDPVHRRRWRRSADHPVLQRRTLHATGELAEHLRYGT